MIVGVDEAGRGPLAGPVVAAAVHLCGTPIRGLDDSKKLKAEKRAVLAGRIRERCKVGVGIASVEEIDAYNILNATMLAMARAVEQCCVALGCDPAEILIDGNLTPEGRRPEWRWAGARAIIGGDASQKCIAAASIIAKETRDAMMADYEIVHPGYGFGQHKGYGTARHLQALREQGPSPIHRRSFAPVAQLALI
ncbi:ribonuclease HII [Sphingomicrobium arenosum]|uniref:ribonuclease HII n=1 Tax=Sphingomicrobium arenosum TaxID=2233861 RepID=UPI00223EA3FF|nr:ribonuclease HII [Sphingomicrobium arenosum]